MSEALRAPHQARQLQKFRALVRHANAHAAYYAKLIRERAISLEACTPADFPPLTKQLLMANFDAITTDRRITRQVVADFLSRSSDPAEKLFNQVTVIHTSGTSGEVGYFVNTAADIARRVRPFTPNGSQLRPALLRRRRPLRRLSHAQVQAHRRCARRGRALRPCQTTRSGWSCHGKKPSYSSSGSPGSTSPMPGSKTRPSKGSLGP